MKFNVFKFGGASVKNAESVRNVGSIIGKVQNSNLLVIVSAMNKTTNELEEAHSFYEENDKEKFLSKLNSIKEFHLNIIRSLFDNLNQKILEEFEYLFSNIEAKIDLPKSNLKCQNYDSIVSLGEILSTFIIDQYLKSQHINSKWIDARDFIKTDDKFQEANVDWIETSKKISPLIHSEKENQILISQGFIASSLSGHTVTLGREGSDFSAAIFAYCLNATSVTIWKDVPGMLNADPKYFEDTLLLEKISFREAIELSYYGASVIHPKTVKPLQNKKIPLFVKSFLDIESKGTTIQESSINDSRIPSYIFKFNQILFTISPVDFSFLIEENLSDIFLRLSSINAKINLMQNSALSFSILLDSDKVDPERLREVFKNKYIVKYNEGLELITIRHYDDFTINDVTKNKQIIVQQRTRSTARFVVKPI